MKKSEKLMINFLLVSFLVLLTIGLIFTVYLGVIAIYLSILLYLILSITTVVKAWTQVPHKSIYVVERYGEFYEILNPGRHFVFPWLNFFRIKSKVFTGSLKMALFDEVIEESDDYKGGIVDFKDESAKIKALFFFHVRAIEDLNENEFEEIKNNLIERRVLSHSSEIDEVKQKIQVELYKIAVYQTNKPIAFIKAKAESALRSFLAQYELLEANELKTNFNLKQIANMMQAKEVKELKEKEKEERKENEEAKKRGEEIKEETPDESWKYSEFGKNLIKWGFTPSSFSITEIQFPDRVIEQQTRVMTARKDKEIAGFKKDAMILLSEGEADSYRNMSKAKADEVKIIADENNVSTEEAFLYIINRQKYEALAKAGNVTWISGAEEKDIKRGVAFGVGFKNK
jgi:regulator of protease activity HflC (stomatin/prohibitin superfamily)